MTTLPPDLRTLVVTGRRGLRRSRLAQAVLLIIVWQAGDIVARTTGVPIPGGVIGLFIALALLASHRVSAISLRRGAMWLLAEMLLFFVPAVPAVLDHPELFGWLGLKIVAVILVGTCAVMGVTALAVDLCYRWRIGHGPAR
ncbi:CidA/LrgA family protein [Segnochrobactrum spirostomi]|uniref:CidA/LrgA family protein n=1 Tax=Segnochrobactrum spirostomi TaxID=2608987 RepID=A0A6A7YAI9_9HYPH|nr:CidA/LrgA family protein [Segnochrobactrum spirostomi]MQT14981.1 CidA/LrgA family protein [Segnochrobactrum spirostomi]